jgi:guanylate kinase
MRPNGKIILVVGPSGSGKDVLIDYVRKLHPEIVFPVSCTTRAPRPGEKNGREYHFISEEAFKKRIVAGDFLEWARYGGHSYGTPRSEIERPLAQGKLALHTIEVQGARQIREVIPHDQLTSVFIDAGSWEELERRIRTRAPITEAELEERKKRYEDEVTFKSEATYVVKNPHGKVEQAKKEFANIIQTLLVS